MLEWVKDSPCSTPIPDDSSISFSLPSLSSTCLWFGLCPSLYILSDLDRCSTTTCTLGVQPPPSDYDSVLLSLCNPIHTFFSNQTFTAPSNSIPNVSTINLLGPPEFPELQVECVTPDNQQWFLVTALLDLGAGRCYVHPELVQKYDLCQLPLESPQMVQNANGSFNKHGQITHSIALLVCIGQHHEQLSFNITNLGRKPMIIGINWLREHNPEIDWNSGTLQFNQCPSSCGARREYIRFLYPSGEELTRHRLQGSIPETQEIEPPYDNNSHDPPTNFTSCLQPSPLFEVPKDFYDIYINLLNIYTSKGILTHLAAEASKHKKLTTMDNILQGPYADFADVFSQEGSCNRPQTRLCGIEYKSIPPSTGSRTYPQWVHWSEPHLWPNPYFQISCLSWVLLCRQEGRQVLPHTGLPRTQQEYGQEQLSPSPHPGHCG